MKRIVFKVPEFPHLSETFIVAQIVTAIKLGYKVQIIVGKLLRTNSSLRNSLIDEYCLLDKVIVEDYIIPKNRILRLLKWTSLLIINLKSFEFILKYHREQPEFSLTWLFQWIFYNTFRDVDVFHVQYGTNSKTLSCLKKIGFKPSLIVTFHGHDAFFPINGFIPNDGYYDNLFQYANLITANTPYLRDKVLELGCPVKRLTIMPVSVDTSFFYPNNLKKITEGTLKLVTVARLDRVKGHHVSIEVIRELVKKNIDVSLTIIGEGIQRKEIEIKIKQYQLEDRVFLLGSKSQEEIRTYLWNHDIYLLLAVPLDDGRRETQGLATLEAQACGLPVIAFDSGGVKYTVEEGLTGFICKEFDTDSVVRRVIEFKLNPELRIRMSKKAVAFMEKKYSQKIIDQKWRLLYGKR
jgi:colanic acid/amylovoran biosynthesis glycosyltransferase